MVGDTGTRLEENPTGKVNWRWSPRETMEAEL